MVSSNKIERSKEVQEILEDMPHWTLRWGMFIITFICISLITGSYFYPYTETLDAPLTISGSNHIINGTLNIDPHHINKIIIGQKVKIFLDGYSEQQYGFVWGYIEQISFVPPKRYYSVSIRFPNHLKTSCKKMIPYNEGMRGKAQIIIKKHSWLKHILEIKINR